jgi:hypothetical protein
MWQGGDAACLDLGSFCFLQMEAIYLAYSDYHAPGESAGQETRPSMLDDLWRIKCIVYEGIILCVLH